ncbi:MAG: hypothetical protein DHS20C12_20870 [Pseudohongiella sp.]|nr:MAG: hypothetical protein DHS20C12_20870 [Pseudohongiella sp.]
MSLFDQTVPQQEDGFSLPLIVAVTGHRELVSAEIETITRRVRELLLELLAQFPSRRLTIMSPLAEGADTLVAEVALDLGLDLIVPLPKPQETYLQDFRSDAARAKFAQLSEKASRLFELPTSIPQVPEGIDAQQWVSDYPYGQLGVYLSSHCHILLALWDGSSSSHLGGTAQVVKFHQDNYMPGITSKTVSTQQLLIDDENDLVFHLVCSHGKDGIDPNSQFTPLDWFWSSKDEDAPLSKKMPTQHVRIFEYGSEFSKDAKRLDREIESQGQGLLGNGSASEFPPGVEDIDRLFSIADYLAIHYQKKVIRTLRLSHLFAFLMGLMFLLYSDFSASRSFLVSFVGLFAVAALLQFVSQRGTWHRKYLDYRTLAEGLRVQFYWAVAGVKRENQWSFTHDNFLQAQDPEVGWIRDVMRVSGIGCDASTLRNSKNLDFAIDAWVGNSETGQLGYYRRVSEERINRNRLTSQLGLLSLLSSIVIVFAFILFDDTIEDTTATAMMLGMGTLLLLFAVREGYAYATAIKELINQYTFMLKVFENAHRRLQLASDDVEKRQILFALGQTALGENADWILMHRERSVDRSEIWRMGS